MELPRTLSLVSYAVNGSGLGHLSRLMAINRWMRRYAAFAGVRTQHWFLTTSEADTMLFAEGFAAFKMPSKSVVEEAGIHKQTYLALAKQWVWHSVALLRPDLFLVDTFPNGSFQELLGVLDLCRHKALVLRPVKEDLARRAAFKAVAALYDRILVPEHEDNAPGMAELLDLPKGTLRHVGPIMVPERLDLVPRDEARRTLGVEGERFCLLVSAGGGGDATVQARLERICALVGSRDDVHVVLAAGPLYRGRPLRGPRITWWTEPGLSTYLHGVDGAVCAAGFNTVHELMFLGVPTVLMPQEKIADDQEGRVDALVAAGAALRVNENDDDALRAAMATLQDPAKARALSQAARKLVPTNHARDAAAQLLELVLPPSVVRHAVRVVDEELLVRCGATGVALGELVDVALALAGDDVDRAALDPEPAMELLETAQGCGASTSVTTRLVSLLGRKLRGSGGSPSDVAQAIGALLEHPGVRGQWSALVTLARTLGSERELPAAALVEQLCQVVELGAQGGTDLFGVARAMTEAQWDGTQEVPNRVLLERTRARLTTSELAK
ncbi:MAG: glycosyltransferase [Myxococcota bacterium]